MKSGPVCPNTVGPQLFIACEKKETILLKGIALIHRDASFTGGNTASKMALPVESHADFPAETRLFNGARRPSCLLQKTSSCLVGCSK